MKRVTLPMGTLPALFDKCGFNIQETTFIISTMIGYWVYNDHNYDVTAEFIRSELELNDLSAQVLINEAMPQLMEMAQQIRQLQLAGVLYRWNVLAFAVVVEIEDDEPTAS